MIGCLNWWPLLNSEIFYRPEWTKGGSHDNEFWLLSNTKMNITNRVENMDEKNGVICLVSMFISWVMVLKLSRKGIFCNFVLISAKTLSLWRQFAYMHLKVLIALFQKMIYFLGVWTTVHEVLAIKWSKNTLTQQKFNKLIWVQTVISLKQ